MDGIVKAEHYIKGLRIPRLYGQRICFRLKRHVRVGLATHSQLDVGDGDRRLIRVGNLNLWSVPSLTDELTRCFDADNYFALRFVRGF